MKTTAFPFAAITAQDDFKLCLLLNLIAPDIGGVLALGDKGTGKTTTVRAIPDLMQGVAPDFRLINLPVGASEDRVLGSVDLEKLVNEKRQVLQKGLLAQAHQGLLYIDEVNLLNDYLIDILLDAAATGGYHLEREGLSVWQESRFVLVGTMNPEEGELRPQLLDRFGLSVQVNTPQELETRKTITQQRLAFDHNPFAFQERFAEAGQALQTRIIQAKQALPTIQVPETIYDLVAKQCLVHQVEGLRADILLIKTAQAYAAWEGAQVVTEAHVRTIAPFVLAHRSKNPNPPDEPNGENNSNPQDNDNSSAQNPLSQEDPTSAPSSFEGASQQSTQVFDKEQLLQSLPLTPKNSHSSPTRKGLNIPQDQHAVLHDSMSNTQAGVAVFKTIRNYTLKGTFKLIPPKKESKSQLWVYFLIDSSGSMTRKKQIAYTKGLIHQTLATHQGKRIRFAAVSLLKGQAEICHPLTDQPQQLLQALDQLPTGGKTNLMAGFEQIHQLMRKNKAGKHHQQQLYIFTDGRVNSALRPHPSPLQQAVGYYQTFLKPLHYTLVVDTESGFIKLGKAKNLADQLGSDYHVL